ncbi:amidohydrolase family protein [Thalassoglobus sp.]|uniref:amidohydrolase family protein n=1 Tax=Thalassoglobus sp. TaxID=2795869 RepID=UPI003AA94240
MITDVNVNLSRWPFRRLPYDEPAQLVRKLRNSEVTSAWAGSFDGLLHKDIAAVNQRLVEDCQTFGDGLLLPVGSVNPTLPAWQDDLRRCHEKHGMKVIRLHPNYHGYSLDDPRFAELLDLSEERKLVVQIALKMEDERTHHPLMQVKTVDPSPLADQLKQRPQLKMILLNSLRTLRGASLVNLANAGNVSFEISMLEGIGGVEKILETIPVEKLLFGSHFPFFYLESSLLKMQESELGNFRSKAILFENAARIVAEE